MKTYSHDYSIPALVNINLNLALFALRNDRPGTAEKLLLEAREMLWQYLLQDNMIEGDDVADGWVKMSDIENLGLLT